MVKLLRLVTDALETRSEQAILKVVRALQEKYPQNSSDPTERDVVSCWVRLGVESGYASFNRIMDEINELQTTQVQQVRIACFCYLEGVAAKSSDSAADWFELADNYGCPCSDRGLGELIIRGKAEYYTIPDADRPHVRVPIDGMQAWLNTFNGLDDPPNPVTQNIGNELNTDPIGTLDLYLRSFHKPRLRERIGEAIDKRFGLVGLLIRVINQCSFAQGDERMKSDYGIDAALVAKYKKELYDMVVCADRQGELIDKGIKRYVRNYEQIKSAVLYADGANSIPLDLCRLVGSYLPWFDHVRVNIPKPRPIPLRRQPERSAKLTKRSDRTKPAESDIQRSSKRLKISN